LLAIYKAFARNDRTDFLVFLPVCAKKLPIPVILWYGLATMKNISLFSLSMLALCASASVFGQQLNSRADLNAYLAGGSSFTDDFEGYVVGQGDSILTGLTTLDSTSVDQGNGPNLVGPGASYSVGSPILGDIRWNGYFYYNLSTQTIGSDNNEIDINYTSPVQAMGIDLADLGGSGGFHQNYILTVYNGSNVVGTIMGTLNGATPIFNGWENAGGITEVTLVDTGSTGEYWSPIIDNSQYGKAQAVPEPSAFILIGLGVVGLAFKCKSRTN